MNFTIIWSEIRVARERALELRGSALSTMPC
jgi:hypothetical protein